MSPRLVARTAFALLLAAGSLACFGDRTREYEDRRRLSFDLMTQGDDRSHQGEFEQALDLYLKAVEYYESPALDYKIGALHHRLGHLEQGALYLDRAIAEQPGFELAKSERELIRLELKEKGIILPTVEEEMQAAGEEPAPRPQAGAATRKSPFTPGDGTEGDGLVESPSQDATQAPEARQSPFSPAPVPPDEPVAEIASPSPTATPEPTPEPTATPAPEATPEPTRAAKLPRLPGESEIERENAAKKKSQGSAMGGLGNLFDAFDPSGKPKQRTMSAGDLDPEEVRKTLFPELGAGTGLDIEAEKQAARDAERIGRYGEAARRWGAVAHAKPDDLESRLAFAQALDRSGRKRRAGEELKALDALAPENAEVHFQWGNHHAEAGRHPEAEAEYRRALEIEPGHTRAMNNLAALFIEDKRFGEAEPLLDRAIAAQPDFAAPYLNRAMVLDELHRDSAGALAAVETYLRLGGEKKSQAERWLEELRGKQE